MLAKYRLSLAAYVALALAVLAPTAAAATPEYFPLPSDHKTVHTGITTDAQGDVWFATTGTQEGTLISPDLARLSVAGASAGQPNGFSFFPTPLVSGEGCCARSVRDVGFDAKNNRVWYVRSRGVIGFASLTSVVPGTETGLSAAGVPGFPDLGGLAVAPNGTVWFTESSSSNVSPFPGNRIASASEGLGITEFPDLWHQYGVPADSTRYDAKPTGIALDSQGFPWFTEADPGNPGYRIGKGVPGTPGTYLEWQVKPCGPGSPCSGSYTGTGVYGIAVDLADKVWFTNVLKNSIGRFDPETQTFTEYPLASIDARLAGGEPRAIELARDGSLWVVERGFISHPAANALVRLAPSDPPTATVYALGAGNTPLSVTGDDRGNIWFVVTTDSSAGSIGRLAGVVGAAPEPGRKPDVPAGEVVVKSSGGGVAKVGEVSIKGTDVWAKQKCVGPPQDPCSLVYLLDSHEYVTGFPGTRPRLAATSAARKTRRVLVGKKAVKIPGGKSTTVKISLNAKGKAILKRDGVLRLTFHATQKVVKGKKKSTKTLKTLKLTIRAPRR